MLSNSDLRTWAWASLLGAGCGCTGPPTYTCAKATATTAENTIIYNKINHKKFINLEIQYKPLSFLRDMLYNMD